MNVRAALLRNTFWYGLVTFIGLVSGLAMSIVLARGLGPALMGDYSYLLWALRTMTALASLGFPLATVRYAAEAYARGEVGGAWSFVRLFLRRQVLTTAATVVVLLPIVAVVVPGDLRWPFVIATLCLFPITVEAVYTSSVYGAQRYDVTTGTSTLKMSLQLVAAVLAVGLGGGILGLVSGLAFSYVVGCLVQRRRARDVYRAGLAAPPAAPTGEMRAYIVPLAVVAVLDAIVWDRSEVFFLRLYASSEAIAFYSLAFGLATRIMVIPEIAAGALLPTFSALHGRNAREEFVQVYRHALRWVGLAGAPLAAVAAALAPGVIVWLYGRAYLPAASLLGVLAVVALVSAMRKVAWAALRAAGDRRCALHATWVAAALNVALAAVLIPGYGIVGAVVANTVAQVVATVWVFIGMARMYGTGFPLADVAKLTAAGLVCWLVTRVAAGGSHEVGWLVLAGGLGLAGFVGVSVLGGLLGAREWSLVITSTRRLLAARASSA